MPNPRGEQFGALHAEPWANGVDELLGQFIVAQRILRQALGVLDPFLQPPSIAGDHRDDRRPVVEPAPFLVGDRIDLDLDTLRDIEEARIGQILFTVIVEAIAAPQQANRTTEGQTELGSQEYPWVP